MSVENKVRTLGDGMDNTLIDRYGINALKDIKINRNLSRSALDALRPVVVEPGTKISYLVPRYVPKMRKVPKYLTNKPKEPKFVPYEPYKAAVLPLRPNKVITKTKDSIDMKPSKNNIEIQELVNQISEIREFELGKTSVSDFKSDDDHYKLRLQWEKEKEAYEIDIKNLRETNSHLENQLKFQAQVNSELKTLLVAAVGEDLESRVQHLTEDKLALARALLNSANHLTSHQEQTEWLSGQCEVWRSKFLASSLMVEELAKWKSALAIRTNELQEVLKTLLDERKKICKKNRSTYSNIKATAEKITDRLNKIEFKYGNIVEVANTNQELSEGVVHVLNLEDAVKKISTNLPPAQVTVAERTAIKLLQNPVTVTHKQDVLCNAVMGAATSLGGRQMYLQHPSMHACCSHCKGEVLHI